MIIFVYNNKGGVTKSTISKNLGHMFSTEDKKVLIISFDPQNNSLRLLGKKYEDHSKGFKHYIQTGEDNILRTRENLYYFPLETDQASDQLSIKIKDKLEILRNKYDIIIIDGAPAKDTVFSKVALEASDKIIFPSLMEDLSIIGIETMLDKVDIDKISCIIPNRFRNTALEKKFYKNLEKNLGDTDIYLASPIPENSLEGQLSYKGKTIWESRSKRLDKTKEIYKSVGEVLLEW